MVAMANSKILDLALCMLFRNKNTTILGFSFYNDLDMLAMHLPEMQFYQVLHNFLDIQDEYARCVGTRGRKIGLKKVVK